MAKVTEQSLPEQRAVTPDRYTVLGVSVSAVNLAQAVEVMDQWIRAGKKDFVVLTGVHGVIEMQKDEQLRRINNSSGMTTPDGMPVVWAGRAKGHKHVEKVYAPTIMLETFRLGVERGYKHFFYGGKEGIADEMARRLRENFPGIEVVGTYCPPFRPLNDTERTDIVKSINRSQADIVWVGIGCPKQEAWMSSFRADLDPAVLIGVGAGFDFLAGERRWAPKWIQNSGFEWLYRLLSDPKHLWKRYARIVPTFLFLYALERLGLKKYDL